MLYRCAGCSRQPCRCVPVRCVFCSTRTVTSHKHCMLHCSMLVSAALTYSHCSCDKCAFHDASVSSKPLPVNPTFASHALLPSTAGALGYGREL